MNNLKSICNEAYSESLDLLRNLSTENGFVASNEDVTNYKRVWGRDGVIAGIAALSSRDEELIKVFKETLRTLSNYQDKTGRIPSNVLVSENKVSYGTTVGRVDATIWFIIGVCQYIIITGDEDMWEECKEATEKAFFYLECLELNGRGLLHIPPGGDWADEYINHGYVLFDQMLYWIAQNLYFQVREKDEVKIKNKKLTELIKVNYFPKKENKESPYVYHQAIFNKALEEYKPPVPVTYFTSQAIRYHLDVFANSLLLLTDILDKEDERMIEHYLFELIKDSTTPILPAFDPVIDEDHPMYDRLKHHYLYEFKNKPYQFHNGGKWPLVNGFFLSSLNNEMIEELEDFAEVLKRDNFKFHEFYHGKTGKAMGTCGLGFSASGYILAYNKIINNIEPFSILKD